MFNVIYNDCNLDVQWKCARITRRSSLTESQNIRHTIGQKLTLRIIYVYYSLREGIPWISFAFDLVCVRFFIDKNIMRL